VTNNIITCHLYIAIKNTCVPYIAMDLYDIFVKLKTGHKFYSS
jgi:hypothetical protein